MPQLRRILVCWCEHFQIKPRYPGSLFTVSNLSLSRFAGHIGLTALADYLSNIRTQIVGVGEVLIQSRDVPSQCSVKQKLILHNKKGLNRLFVPPEFRSELLNKFHGALSDVGVRSFRAVLSRLFCWPGIDEDAKLIVKKNPSTYIADQTKPKIIDGQSSVSTVQLNYDSFPADQNEGAETVPLEPCTETEKRSDHADECPNDQMARGYAVAMHAQRRNADNGNVTNTLLHGIGCLQNQTLNFSFLHLAFTFMIFLSMIFGFLTLGFCLRWFAIILIGFFLSLISFTHHNSLLPKSLLSSFPCLSFQYFPFTFLRSLI